MIVNGHWSKRVNGTTTGVMEPTDSISTFAVDAGPGGAVMLVWRVAMQLQRVELADAAQRWGAVEHPKAGNREEWASGRLACAQCAQMGEAESVSQSEDSTGHGPRLAERAQIMLHGAMKVGKQQ